MLFYSRTTNTLSCFTVMDILFCRRAKNMLSTGSIETFCFVAAGSICCFVAEQNNEHAPCGRAMHMLLVNNMLSYGRTICCHMVEQYVVIW